MKLVYDGVHDEVEVTAAGVVARRGEPVEIDDQIRVVVGETEGEQPRPIEVRLVDSLLEQSVWRKAGAKGTSDVGGEG